VAYLFDTDAISELFRPSPRPGYVAWLRRLSPEDQFTSAVVVGELYEGAFRSGLARHLENIEERVLPRLVVLPYDAGVAQVFGQIASELQAQGRPLADADLQIAATALRHGLELVTGNVRHFGRVQGLKVARALADARREG